MNALEELKKRVASLEKQYDGEMWLDAQDVYEILHISARSLQTWRDTGLIPYYKFGKKCWYKRKDLDATLQAMKQHNELRSTKRCYRAIIDFKERQN